MQPDELSIIDRFFRPLSGNGAFNLLDDAGRLDIPAGSDLVVTTDMVAESVHYLPSDPPDTIAMKALRVNLSDLAAKGAKPLAYVLSVALSPRIDETWLAGFADGLRRDQDEFGVSLLGGDTIGVPDRAVVSITAFGTAPKGRMVHRQGGRPGDILYVSGTLGGAAAGLALLKGEAGPWDALPPAVRDELIGRYRVPQPRVALSPALVEFASAAMDISDGLIGDCDKLSAASACTASVEAELAPLASGLGAADEALLARFLTSGDDYEILAAIPTASAAAFAEASHRAGVPVSRVGVLEEGRGPANVLFQGRPLRLSKRAFVHSQGERT